MAERSRCGRKEDVSGKVVAEDRLGGCRSQHDECSVEFKPALTRDVRLL